MIESNETGLRTEMDGIYINKTKQIINTGRLREEYMTREEKMNMQAEFESKLKVWEEFLHYLLIDFLNLYLNIINKNDVFYQFF